MIPWQLAAATAAARKEKTHSIGAESKRDSKSENRMPLSWRLGRASRVGRRTTRNLIDSWNGNYPGSGRLLDPCPTRFICPTTHTPPVCLCAYAPYCIRYTNSVGIIAVFSFTLVRLGWCCCWGRRDSYRNSRIISSFCDGGGGIIRLSALCPIAVHCENYDYNMSDLWICRQQVGSRLASSIFFHPRT